MRTVVLPIVTFALGIVVALLFWRTPPVEGQARLTTGYAAVPARSAVRTSPDRTRS